MTPSEAEALALLRAAAPVLVGSGSLVVLEGQPPDRLTADDVAILPALLADGWLPRLTDAETWRIAAHRLAVYATGCEAVTETEWRRGDDGHWRIFYRRPGEARSSIVHGWARSQHERRALCEAAVEYRDRAWPTAPVLALTPEQGAELLAGRAVSLPAGVHLTNGQGAWVASETGRLWVVYEGMSGVLAAPEVVWQRERAERARAAAKARQQRRKRR